MFDYDDSVIFRDFAKSLKLAISRYDEITEENRLERQKNQVETLIGLESQFREALIKHPNGMETYKGFIKYITETKKNVLAARPFFRERQKIFSSQITEDLQNRNAKGLFKYHFNWYFINFVLNFREWEAESDVVKLAKQIRKIRLELVETNLPLAINRARIFWSSTPKSQLSYMDMVQICAEGLMNGIDKFVLPYSKVFRSVAIGRMVGNLIESYSETLVHFYPTDKRKLYKANKIIHEFADNVDFDKLAQRINAVVDGKQQTSASEIAHLMGAASTVSADSVAPTVEREDEHLPALDRFTASDDVRPDNQYEETETKHVLHDAIRQLSLMERKLLRLKGIEINIRN